MHLIWIVYYLGRLVPESFNSGAWGDPPVGSQAVPEPGVKRWRWRDPAWFRPEGLFVC